MGEINSFLLNEYISDNAKQYLTEINYLNDLLIDKNNTLSFGQMVETKTRLKELKLLLREQKRIDTDYSQKVDYKNRSLYNNNQNFCRSRNGYVTDDINNKNFTIRNHSKISRG